MQSILRGVLLISEVACIAFQSLAADATNVESQVAGDLAGHLQPFGFQRPASYPIDEISDAFSLSPVEFYSNYVVTRRPVVFRGAAKHFKAYKDWTKAALAANYGKLELRIEPRKDGASGRAVGELGMGRDTMENFVKTLETSDNYVVSELPVPMYGDVELLPCMSCGRLRTMVSEINLWMSGGGTRSRLHRDAFNAINCQLNGTKDWIMVPPNQTDNVYFKASSDWELGGLSPVNTDSIDLKKYPRIRNVPWGITTVEGGDCIFIPGGHYHQVRSYGFTNIAVSVLFSRLEMPHAFGFDEAECDGWTPEFVPLSAVPEILWQYPGHGMMTMGNADGSTLTAILFTETKGKPLKKSQFLSGEDNMLDMPDKKTARKAWAILDTDNDGVMTRSDALNVSRDGWRLLSRIAEPFIVYSNSYDYEYAILEHDMLRTILRRALRSHKQMDEGTFVKVYTDVGGGSEYFGKRLFRALDTEQRGRVTATVLQNGRLETALEPYLVTEEDDGGNHFADGDGEDDHVGEMEAADLLRRVLGQDQTDIEEDGSLTDSERDVALDAYQERASNVNTLLGLDDDDDNDDDGGDEGDEEEDDEENINAVYRSHLEKIRAESEEVDAAPYVQEELVEVTPQEARRKTEL